MSVQGLYRTRLPLYLIPIVFGMAGVLFSRRFDSAIVGGTVILLSVALPVFAAGHLLARLQMKRRERFMLIGGLFLRGIGPPVPATGQAHE